MRKKPLTATTRQEPKLAAAAAMHASIYKYHTATMTNIRTNVLFKKKQL